MLITLITRMIAVLITLINRMLVLFIKLMIRIFVVVAGNIHLITMVLNVVILYNGLYTMTASFPSSSVVH